MEKVSSGRSTSRFVFCLRMILILLKIQNLKRRGKETWEKNAWAVAEVVLRFHDAPAPRGYMSAMMVDKPDDMIFYSGDFMNQYHDAANNKKNSVLGHGYFAKLASFEDERYIGRNIGQDDGRACAFRPSWRPNNIRNCMEICEISKI